MGWLLERRRPTWLSAAAATELVDLETIAHAHTLSASRIGELQSGLLGELVAHVRSASAAWNERLGGGASRLADLPVLAREEYRSLSAAGALSLPAPRGESHESSTSGSSGMPVRFHHDALSKRLMASHALYRWQRHGLLDGRPAAAILPGLPVHPGAHMHVPGRPHLNQAPTIARNARQFTIEAHARWIAEQGRPHLITVPTILGGLVDVYESGQVAPPRLDRVLTYAETVDVELRRRVRELLGAPIMDEYSCEEIGPIALQCPDVEESYHLAVTNTVVEILDEAGGAAAEGALGRIIVTGLNNYASPAIRYELGDVGAWGRGCGCGFDGPVLRRLLGRKRFLIKLPSGERKYVGTPSQPWVQIAPFRERRLIQREEGRLSAELVLDRPITSEERRRVIDLLEREISPLLSYDVVQVETIDWGPSYKRQDVVSLI